MVRPSSCSTLARSGVRRRVRTKTGAPSFCHSRQRRSAEFGIAESYYRQSEFDEAGKRLDRLDEEIRRSKNAREPWMGIVPLRRAELLARRGQWNDAQALAAAIEKDYPGFPQQYDADYLLGRCWTMQADFEAARRAYDRVIHCEAGAKTETAAKAQWRIGETFFLQKNYKTAYQEYLKVEILYAYPEQQAAALLEAGNCCEKLGDAKRAAECYRQIVDGYPKTAVAPEAAQRLTKQSKSKSTNPTSLQNTKKD